MSVDLRPFAGGADRFVVLDVETTGVYPTDRVVELSMVTLSTSGEVLDVFDTMIQPGRDVSATHIHGITATMVADAPMFADVAGDVAIRLHGACLVAHNVPFDRRMVQGEFARLNESFEVTRAIDTLSLSQSRLVEACATHGIPLEGAHRSLNDAVATSSLFLALATQSTMGAPVLAPLGLRRTGRVRRREDATFVVVPEPPLIVYLASRLALSGTDTRTLQYLEVLGRAISDLHLDPNERAHLVHIATEAGLSTTETASAHRRFLNELIDAATADSVVTDDEYEALVRVAACLDIDQHHVETRIRRYRTGEQLVTLQPGMAVVFTGDHRLHDRAQLQNFARSIGLAPQPGVNKSTQLVAAADIASNSGKAAKAQQYGIPIVAIDDLLKATNGATIAAVAAHATPLKVITCPDCRATRTVPATSATARLRRCDPCATTAANVYRRHTATRPAPATWPPPRIEWLTCAQCDQRWHRETTRGRKPRLCQTCVQPNFSPPQPPRA